VFGCGGDRDAGKRPQMGKAASELADSVIITDDNPRSEDPTVIREAIRVACPSARVIGDRREAIGFSLGQLQAGDILVIAGKGHEKTQIIGTRVMPFNDVDVVRQATKDLKFVV
jgi:UDP-N-acetylmuramoyl-L-alanyl-D-glutamate--2,6-diaminopimelate ligase